MIVIAKAVDPWLQPNLPRVSPFKRFLWIFVGRKIVVIGAAMVVMAVLVAISAPYLAPYDPYAQNLREALQEPSAANWLGTDQLGRDFLSRILYGTRTSLSIGLGAVGIAVVCGVALGVLAGYFGGIVDTLIMRCMDALLALPPIMLALVFRAILGGGMTNVMLSLGIALMPYYARLMRGQTVAVRQLDYIKASNIIGCSDGQIMLHHILPNCLPPLIVLVTLDLGYTILAEAGLSFLGLGIAPPTAAWGAMVNDGYRYLLSHPLLSLAPGVCIMLVVLGFALLGDGVRDALDPRLRGTL
jgi:ABC-type dipeptide/oligopeptide/nickel transport system permease subunit